MSTQTPRGDASAEPGRKTARTARTSTISGLVLYVLVLAAILLPVPYMIQMPGPVVNTLEKVKGQDLVTIEGTQTYPASGQLDLLTVAVAGGPDRSVFSPQVLRGVFAHDDTVIPSEAYYPLGTTGDEVSEENSGQMASSQDTATAAALTELGIDYDSRIEVASVVEGTPAEGELEVGDVITSVDGQDLAGSAEDMKKVSETVQEGDPVTLGIEREGTASSVEVTPEAAHGVPMIGVTMQQAFDFPFDVTFNVEDIGGPSAGTIFALTIIDELTPGDMTGNVPIAGTGEISPEGTVSPIGGARQKVSAASDAGAEYFLSPKDNCAEVVEAAARTDLTVVRIDDLHSARTSIESIAAGETTDLPSCEAAQG